MFSRRELLSACVVTGTASISFSQPSATQKAPFTLPSLPYAADALEPHIDAETMRIHHGKHHAAYVSNLNAALSAGAGLSGMSLDELLRNLDKVPSAQRIAVRNNAGGHSNHSLFWSMLSAKGGKPSLALQAALDSAFRTDAGFREQFTKSALGTFGSGWAWLTIDRSKRLTIDSTANQDSPISSGKTPLLGIDVWEHAYYLKYQNRRADYITAFWNVINWDFVSERFQTASSQG